MDRLMTLAACARRRGVNRSTVTRWKQAGLLVMQDNRVEADASDRLLQEHRGCAESPVYAQALAADMIFRAKLRKLECEARQARLVEAEAVRKRWTAIRSALEALILAWAAEVAPQIAPLNNERQIRDVLMRECRTLLERARDAVIQAREAT